MFEAVHRLDLLVYDWFSSRPALPVFDAVMIFLTYFFYGFWLICSIVFLFRRETRGRGVSALVSLLVMLLCNNLILKNWIRRPRPFVSDPSAVLKIPAPDDYSFPSGHASASSCAARSLAGENGALFAVFSLIAVLISFSRIYLCVHYFSDVVFGYLLGFFYSFCGGFLSRKIFPRFFPGTPEDSDILKR